MRKFTFVVSLLFSVATQISAQEGAKVLSVTPALAVLGQELAPDGVTVAYPGPPEENASDWQPDDAILRRYQQADLVLLVGADYAGWVATTALPRARRVDTSAAFSDRFITRSSDIPGHQHGPQGSANHHSAYANHFWLDLELAKAQAATIAGMFIALWPHQTDEIATNLADLQAQLTRLQTTLSGEFSSLGEVNFLASHPVYQYLDRAHGLGLRNFHWEPDQHPSPDDWTEFEAALAANQPNLMIWEAEPLPQTRAELERHGVGLIIISPSQPDHRTGSLRARLGFPDRIGKGG